MKRIAVLAALALSACAQTPAPSQQRQELVQFSQWREIELQKARAGQEKWSVTYESIFKQASKLPADAPGKGLYLEITDRMITKAQEFESGAITQDQFKAEQRQAGIRWTKEMERFNEMSAAEQAEYNRRAHAAALQLMLDNNRKPAHQPYQMQPLPAPQTTRCQTTGNQTTCQTQ